MRGAFVDQGGLFSYIAPEARVPANHPLRKIRELVRDVLGELNRSLGRLYASEGRPAIPPEQLLSALLLQVFYGIRSERQLMEQAFCVSQSQWPRLARILYPGGSGFKTEKAKRMLVMRKLIRSRLLRSGRSVFACRDRGSLFGPQAVHCFFTRPPVHWDAQGCYAL